MSRSRSSSAGEVVHVVFIMILNTQTIWTKIHNYLSLYICKAIDTKAE